jgi:hypothetical protein
VQCCSPVGRSFGTKRCDAAFALLSLEKVPLKVEGFPLGVVTTEMMELRFSTPGQG